MMFNEFQCGDSLVISQVIHEFQYRYIYNICGMIQGESCVEEKGFKVWDDF